MQFVSLRSNLSVGILSWVHHFTKYEYKQDLKSTVPQIKYDVVFQGATDSEVDEVLARRSISPGPPWRWVQALGRWGGLTQRVPHEINASDTHHAKATW